MSLTEHSQKYHDMKDEAKKDFIETAYHGKNMSYPEIAKLVGTYPNKIRRDAQRLGVSTRTASEAQALALKTGKHKHPTKGKKRSEETKLKISETRAEKWNNISDKERKRLSKLHKERWENMSDSKKKEIQAAAHAAIRQSAIEGSKLEKYLHQELIAEGYRVDLHREYSLPNARLQIDLFMPELNIAIEVDGPTHHEPIWGDDEYKQTKKADNQKTGLILGQGLVLVRVNHTKALSQSYKRKVLGRLLGAIHKIEEKFPEAGKRHIILKD
jgi:very-short-patch-repair endonuclease